MKKYTVKARDRTGSPSFDLTIPTEVTKEYNIIKGDIFEVVVEKDDNSLKIIYKLVYRK